MRSEAPPAASRCIPERLPTPSPAICSAPRTLFGHSPPTRAAKRCSITTTSHKASCKPRKPSAATTSSATTPPTTKPDGKFRKVKITLANNQSAALDYRQGYYAGKDFSKYTTADKERQLEDALMLGDPVTDLTIAMEIGYFQLNRAEYFVSLAVKIPGQ